METNLTEHEDVIEWVFRPPPPLPDSPD